MLNRIVFAGIIFALSAALIPAGLASDTVPKLFQKFDKQALSVWHQGPVSEDAEKKQAFAIGKQIMADIADLTPAQLVELVRHSENKIREIPSDPSHERYFGYFEDVIHFTIMRLGEQKTSEAREALDKVKRIISGRAALMETWDEARKKQNST